MSRVVTVVDMRGFEGALDEEFCHIIHSGGSLCGCREPGPSTHMGSFESVRCSGCGRLNCPDCQAMLR